MQHEAIAQDHRPVARNGGRLPTGVDGVLHAAPRAEDPGLREPGRTRVRQDGQAALPRRPITPRHSHPRARTDGTLNRRDDALRAREADVGRQHDAVREPAVALGVFRSADLDAIDECRQPLMEVDLANRRSSTNGRRWPWKSVNSGDSQTTRSASEAERALESIWAS